MSSAYGLYDEILARETLLHVESIQESLQNHFQHLENVLDSRICLIVYCIAQRSANSFLHTRTVY